MYTTRVTAQRGISAKGTRDKGQDRIYCKIAGAVKASSLIRIQYELKGAINIDLPRCDSVNK